MRIVELKGESEKDVIAIAPKNGESLNWITIITGANGTRKSIVLRLLSSAALGSIGVKMTGIIFNPISISAINKKNVNRVIAISGTPFDRFSKSNAKKIAVENSKNEYESAYTYFGFKSINGATGAIGITRVIGSLLWKRREKLSDRKSSLSEIFKFLNLQPVAEVRIKRPSFLNSNSRDSNPDGLKRGDFNSKQLVPFLNAFYERYQNEPGGDLAIYVRHLLRSKVRVAKLGKFLKQFPSSISFDIQSGITSSTLTLFEEFDIEILLEIGLLVVDDLFVKRAKEISSEEIPYISASSLSSGQWQLLLGLLGLGLEIEDNTTIVIDEPENSLHPEWQRQYIQLLEKVISEKKGCHTIIATHSPLITSGVDGRRGNLIRLIPNSESAFGVISEKLTQNFGWDVNKTLELLFEMQTTRGSSFVEMVDAALAMIRDQNTKSEEFLSLAESIVTASKNIPKGDPLLQISLAIGNFIPRRHVQ